MLIAAGLHQAAPVVQLLVDPSAGAAVKSARPRGDTTPLTEAPYAGQESVVRMLLERGADPKAAGPLPLEWRSPSTVPAAWTCSSKPRGPIFLSPTMFMVVPPMGDAVAVKTLIDRGADARMNDELGRHADTSRRVRRPPDQNRESDDCRRGCECPGPSGATAWDRARQHAETPSWASC